MIREEDLSSEKLLGAVKEVYDKRTTYISMMEASNQHNAVVKVADIIDEIVK